MIKSIDIKNLRGISLGTKIVLDDRSLVIFGENGKGKTSIIDGIEYAMTGDIKHISSGCKEVTLAKHAANITSSFKDIEASIIFNDSSKLTNFNEVDEGSLAFKMRNSRAGQVNILRRSQLLSAIYVAPKDRYDILRPFLPLNEVTMCENSLKEAVDKFDTEIKEKKSKIEEIDKNIKDILKIEGKEKIDNACIVRHLSERTKELGITILKGIDEISKTIKDVDNAITKIGDSKYDTEYRKIIEITDEIKKMQVPTIILNNIFNDINSKLELDLKGKIVFYEEFLKTGVKWIEEERSSKCPFCENEIVVKDVINRINERLCTNSDYVIIKNKFNTDYKYFESIISSWLNIIDKLRTVNIKVNDNKINDLCKTLTDNINIMRTGAPKSIGDNIIEKKLPEWSSDITLNANEINKKYNAKVLNRETVEKITKLLKFKENLNSIVDYVEKKDSQLVDYKLSEKKYSITNDFYNEFVNQRKKSVQDIYNEIKKDINKFYDAMHPHESIGELNLKIKETKSSGSAIIESKFFEKDKEDPRAYYSEGHLDTLGLAIFLALYKRECSSNKDLKFLVLDDILTSVDANHRTNIINLIFKEFKEHQLIITTHERTLYNEIIELENKNGGTQNFKNIEICDWTKEQGPILSDTKSEFEKLKGLYDDLHTDKNTLAADTGRFLELILQNMRYSLELSVPAKYKDKYTIGDIWSNLYCKLNKNNEFKELYGSVLENINNFTFLRNVDGCHYNEWADDISKDEVRLFTNNVIDLYNVVFCSKCSSFISLKSDSDDYFCKCKREPLKYYKRLPDYKKTLLV